MESLEMAGAPETLIDVYKEVLGVAITSNGRYALTSSADGVVRLWDLNEKRQVHKFVGHSDWAWGACMTPDGRVAASCSRDWTVRVWDLVTCSEKCKIQHNGEVMAVAITDDGSKVVSCEGKNVMLWDPSSGRQVGVKKGHTSVVRCVAVDFEKVISGSQDNTIRVWELEGWTCRMTLEGHTAVVRGLALRADMLVSCSLDASIMVWNLKNGELLTRLEGHQADVRGVALSGDGTLAVSCSFDRSVRVWDVGRGQETACFTGHTDKIFGVALDESGYRAVSCSWDLSMRVWDIRGGTHSIIQPHSSSTVTRTQAPDSLIGSHGIIAAVQAAMSRKAGYQLQSDEISEEPEVLEDDGLVDMNLRSNLVLESRKRKQRIRVEIDEETGPVTLTSDMQGQTPSPGLMSSMVDVLSKMTGRKEAGEIEADEEAWVAKILQEEATSNRKGISLKPFSRDDPGSDDELDWEDDDEEQILRKVKDTWRSRSSLALVLGFLCFFPWLAGCCIAGGLRSKDKMVR